MNQQTKLAFALAAMFVIGLVLVAIGMGWNTRPAAFAVGFLMTMAATRLVAGGPR